MLTLNDEQEKALEEWFRKRGSKWNPDLPSGSALYHALKPLFSPAWTVRRPSISEGEGGVYVTNPRKDVEFVAIEKGGAFKDITTKERTAAAELVEVLNRQL